MRLTPLAALLLSAPAAAQLLPPAPAPYVASFARQAGPQSPPLVPKDHAWEGATFGAVVLGLGGTGLAYGICSEGDDGHPTSFGYCAPRSLLGGLIGATLGAIIGGFIGSTVPNAPATPAP